MCVQNTWFRARPGRRVSHRWHRPLYCPDFVCLRTPSSKQEFVNFVFVFLWVCVCVCVCHCVGPVGALCDTVVSGLIVTVMYVKSLTFTPDFRFPDLSLAYTPYLSYTVTLQAWERKLWQSRQQTPSRVRLALRPAYLPVYCACLPRIPVHVLDCAAFCRPCMLHKLFLPITHPRYIYRAAASCGVFKSYFDRAIRDCSLVLQPAPEQYRLWRLLSVLFTPFLALALAL